MAIVKKASHDCCLSIDHNDVPFTSIILTKLVVGPAHRSCIIYGLHGAFAAKELVLSTCNRV